MTYAQLQPLRVFSWLLTEQENAFVLDMVKGCAEKKKDFMVVAASSAASSSSSFVAVKDKEFEPTAMKQARDMFN